MVQFLRQVTLFRNFSTEELHTFLKIAKTVEVSQKQFVFQEGDKDRSLYIIFEGSVEIIKQGAPEEMVELAFIRSGDYFGELSLIDNQARSASVRAFEPTILIKLDSLGYQELSQRQPSAEVKMLRAFVLDISRRLRSTNEMLTHFKHLIF